MYRITQDGQDYLVHPENPVNPVKLTHQSLNNLIALLERGSEVLRLVAAALGHVCLAATFTTDDWRQFFDHLSGRNFAGEIRRRADDERNFSIAASPKHNHARLDAREQRV